jgi:hypothetical protein
MVEISKDDMKIILTNSEIVDITKYYFTSKGADNFYKLSKEDRQYFAIRIVSSVWRDDRHDCWEAILSADQEEGKLLFDTVETIIRYSMRHKYNKDNKNERYKLSKKAMEIYGDLCLKTVENMQIEGEGKLIDFINFMMHSYSEKRSNALYCNNSIWLRRLDRNFTKDN